MLFLSVELTSLQKFFNASYNMKQIVHRLKWILAVVVCIQIFTVTATSVIVSEELSPRSYPSIYPCIGKDLTFSWSIVKPLRKLGQKILIKSWSKEIINT